MGTVSDGDERKERASSQPLTEETTTSTTIRQLLTSSIGTLTSPSPSHSSSSDPHSDSLHVSFLLILTFDLLVEILCKLPVKSLMQLRCVCKSLNSLISDPKFTKKHIHRSMTLFTRHHLVLCCTDWDSEDQFPIWDFQLPSVFNSSVSTIIPEEQLNCPRNIPRCYDLIVASCDGILCFCPSYDRRSVLVWNPSIMKFKILPPLEFQVEKFRHFIYAFGYDHYTDNYKVVALCFYQLDESYWDCEIQVRIHTLGTSSWRRVQDFPSIVMVDTFLEKSGKFVSSTVNWLVSSVSSSPLVIVSLDLANESYHELLQPNYGGVAARDPTLGVLRECLCVIFYGDTFLDVWILKDYANIESWTKLFTVPYMEIGYDSNATYIELGYESGLLDVRYIFEDDQVLLEFNNELVIYNSKNGTVKRLEIQYIYSDRFFTDVYVESLILP